MSIFIDDFDGAPCIILDGEHLKLDFDMGSKCDGPVQENDGLTAVLYFYLNDEGCTCTATLLGKNAAGMSLETETCFSIQEISLSDFDELTGNITVLEGCIVKQTIVNLAFGKPDEIDLEGLRQEMLNVLRGNLEEFEIAASCGWDCDLQLCVSISRFGIQKLQLDFEIPYDSAVVVLQDRRPPETVD